MFEMRFAKIFRSINEHSRIAEHVNEHGNFVQFLHEEQSTLRSFLHSYVFALKTFFFSQILILETKVLETTYNAIEKLASFKINKCPRGIYFSIDFSKNILSQEFRYKLKSLLLSMLSMRSIISSSASSRSVKLKGWLVDDQFQSVARIRGKSRTNTGNKWTTNGKKNALGSWDRIGSFSAILLNTCTNYSSRLKRPRVTT